MKNEAVEQLRSWFPAARRRLEKAIVVPSVEHVGSVGSAGDGIALVSGLPDTRLDELLNFEGGGQGLAFRVGEEAISCVMLSHVETVRSGMKVRGTGEVFRVPVGMSLLGRTLNSAGHPIDNGPPLEPEDYLPIDRPAPAIIERDLVSEPLQSGITVIDSMIPLGRGQRELIIGDRKTGKTAIAVDTMINQRESDVICVYAAIGQKASSVDQVIESVRRHGDMSRCLFVVGAADDAPGAQWITPYSACTMAEYYRDRGHHVLLVLDDLTKHAIVYRQLSLLLRRPPGREAYPGDIFYVHSRLLERSAKLSEGRGGGSLTALPIAETQGGNLTAYIPTNLVSITDGQIYLEPKLFYEGQKPAVNVGLSVSRVGGKTQAPVMKQLARTIRLDYAQFLELEVFARFGAMVDERTEKALEHGRRIRAILQQPQYRPKSLIEQIALLLAINGNCLEKLPLDAIPEFKSRLGEWLDERCPGIADKVNKSGEMSEEEQDHVLKDVEALIEAVAAAAGPGD
jgi:F-type H+-transporting ATPase subunit alpha